MGAAKKIRSSKTPDPEHSSLPDISISPEGEGPRYRSQPTPHTDNPLHRYKRRSHSHTQKIVLMGFLIGLMGYGLGIIFTGAILAGAVEINPKQFKDLLHSVTHWVKP